MQTLKFGSNSIIALITMNCFNIIILIIMYAIKLYEIGDSQLKKVKDELENAFELISRSSSNVLLNS